MAATGLTSARLKTSHRGSLVVAACVWWHRQSLCFLSIQTVSHIKQAHHEIFYPQFLACVLHADSVRGVLHTGPPGQQVRKGKTDARATRGADLSSRRAAWHESRTACETGRASSSNTEEEKTIRSSRMTHQDLDGTHHPASLAIVAAETTGCNLRQQLGAASKNQAGGKNN